MAETREDKIRERNERITSLAVQLFVKCADLRGVPPSDNREKFAIVFQVAEEFERFREERQK